MEVRLDRARRAYLEFATGEGTCPAKRKPAHWHDCLHIEDGQILVVRVWDHQWEGLATSDCDPVRAAFTLLDSTLHITENALSALEKITMSNTRIAILKSGQVIRATEKVLEKHLDNTLLALVPPTAEGESTLLEQIEACDARTLVLIAKAMKVEAAADIDAEAKKVRLKPDVRKALEEAVLECATAKGKRDSADGKGQVNKPKRTPKEGGVRTGVKPQIRAFFESGKKATLEELMEKFPGAAKSSITTAIADLRSDKYAGAGGALNITKDDKGKYSLSKD